MAEVSREMGIGRNVGNTHYTYKVMRYNRLIISMNRILSVGIIQFNSNGFNINTNVLQETLRITKYNNIIITFAVLVITC